MAAEIGNKLAEKWTKEAAIELLDRSLASITDNCYFLSEVCVAVDEYPDLFTYLAKKFEEDEDVFRAIKRLYIKCESVITRKTANGEIVPSLGIFILKAYHNLMETSKVQSEHSGSVNVPVPQVTVYNTAPPLASSENEIEA